MRRHWDNISVNQRGFLLISEFHLSDRDATYFSKMDSYELPLQLHRMIDNFFYYQNKINEEVRPNKNEILRNKLDQLINYNQKP